MHRVRAEAARDRAGLVARAWAERARQGRECKLRLLAVPGWPGLGLVDQAGPAGLAWQDPVDCRQGRCRPAASRPVSCRREPVLVRPRGRPPHLRRPRPAARPARR